MVQRYKSDAARARLRQILEAARSGEDSIIDHYDTPTAVVIPYEDYVALQEELDDLRMGRRARAEYESWQRDSTLGRPWEEVEAELVALEAQDKPDAAPGSSGAFSQVGPEFSYSLEIPLREETFLREGSGTKFQEALILALGLKAAEWEILVKLAKLLVDHPERLGQAAAVVAKGKR